MNSRIYFDRPMRVLGIETSGERGGVALLEEDRVLAARSFGAGMIHGRRIAPTLQAMLQDLELTPEGIDLVACDIGPGSYTGLRVGLAAAKGLAFALERPLIGVPSLDAMAEAALEQARLLCPVLDARWGQIYGALYEDGRRLTEYLVEPPAVFADRVPPEALVFGDALEAHGEWFRHRPQGPPELWVPRPEMIARLGRRRYQSGDRHDPASIVPLYLRPTEAELKLRSR